MSEVILKVENLSKKYIIGHNHESFYSNKSLRDTISDGFKSIIKRFFCNFTKDTDVAEKEEFWALKKINFEVRHGESIGIIGRNGAGKSTLLKLLSRITEPTTGRINIKGRTASLLEVGTGFHPELSGRENIYLNGAILGMSKAEIMKKFDEIVSFSEIEKFLDTPVKRYSSGMYVRLAFAVAAHLEPEILIVDEVLAVGDAQFQKKCLGKMEDVSKKQGRTVLFVSHNMGAINSLCSKVIFLNSGEIVNYDTTEKTVPLYLATISNKEHNKDINVRYYFLDSDKWDVGTTIAIEVSWEKYKFNPGWNCDLACYTLNGEKIFAIQSNKIKDFSSENRELTSITFFIENIGFAERELRIDIGIKKSGDLNYSVLVEHCLTLIPGGDKLPEYKRKDVTVVPHIYCKVK